MIGNYSITRICKICGKEFVPKTISSIYCCHKCSNVAYKKKVDAERKDEARREFLRQVKEERKYVSVEEASVIYGLSKDTIYRQVRLGYLDCVRVGKKRIMINRDLLKATFGEAKDVRTIKEEEVLDIEKVKIEDCYTITEVIRLLGVCDTAVAKLIRDNSIPSIKKGKFVYVPRVMIEKLMK